MPSPPSKLTPPRPPETHDCGETVTFRGANLSTSPSPASSKRARGAPPRPPFGRPYGSAPSGAALAGSWRAHGWTARCLMAWDSLTMERCRSPKDWSARVSAYGIPGGGGWKPPRRWEYSRWSMSIAIWPLASGNCTCSMYGVGHSLAGSHARSCLRPRAPTFIGSLIAGCCAPTPRRLPSDSGGGGAPRCPGAAWPRAGGGCAGPACPALLPLRLAVISSVECAKAHVSSVYLHTPCRWYMQKRTFFVETSDFAWVFAAILLARRPSSLLLAFMPPSGAASCHPARAAIARGRGGRVGLGGAAPRQRGRPT
mmetsp:Transcript_69958/g.198555  ORF Transcript_69958/g.198555 Transcript_69958/m.198555 type:complete len:312 (+) Transcript_69958:477-1412(+)